MGTVEMDDDYCAGLAHRLGILVASVEYRLSPDFPYPIPLVDCYTGLHWLHDNAATLGVDQAQIGIGGGSGGGAICAGLGLLARDRAEVPVCYQFLVFPMIDDRNQTEMSQAVLDPRLWNRTANLIGWNSYLEGGLGARHPDLRLCLTCHRRAARRAPADLHERRRPRPLRRRGRRVRPASPFRRRAVDLHVYPGAFHGSNNSVSRSDLSRRWKADERAALHRAFHGRELHR